MSIWDSIQGLFSPSQTTNSSGTTATQGTGTQEQQGTTAQTSTPFLQWLASQTANGALGTALSGNTAGNALIGQSAGITPAQVASFANPNAEKQIAATFDPNGALARSQAAGLSAVRGAASGNPYASSTAGTVKDYEAQVAANNANTAAGITTSAWAPATSAALGSAGLGVQGGTALNTQLGTALGQVPSLINSAGATNVGQNNTTGQTTQNTTGQTTGNQNITQTPSLGGVLGGLGGLALTAFGGRQQAKDGGAILGYETGGAVRSKGGGVDGFHGKVREAFHTFHGLRKEAEHGHKRKGFAAGGWDASTSAGDPDGWGASVLPFNGTSGGPPSGDDHWDGVRAAAINNGNPDVSPQAQPSMWGRLATGLTNLGSAGQFKPMGGADKGNDDPIGLKALQAQMASARGYDDGGAVRHGYADGDLVTPDGPSRGIGDYVSDALGAIPKPFSTGMWTRDEYGVRNAPTALQDAGRLLAGFGANAGFNGAKTALSGPAEALNEIANERYKDRAEGRADAAVTGAFRGADTMAAKQMQQARDLALGRIGDQTTLAGRQQSEAEAKARLPEYKTDTGNYDALGRPIPAWVNPYNAPDAAMAPAPNYGGPALAKPSATAPIGGAASIPAPNNRNAEATKPVGEPGSATNPVYIATPAGEEQFKRDNPGGYYRTQDNPTKIKQAPVAAGAGAAPPATPAVAAASPEPAQPAPKPAPSTPGIVPATTSTMDNDATGTEAFNQLPKAMQIAVAQALDGRSEPPRGVALKDPHQQAIINAARMVQPDFDMAKWAARSNAYKEFNSAGTKTRTKIESADKVISHINDLDEAIDKLHNTGYPFGSIVRAATNPVLRSAMPNSVGVAFKDFETAKNLAMKEFQTFLSGKGGGADRELQELGSLLSNTSSTTELKGVVHRMLKMMHGQLGPMGETYAKAFNMPEYDSRNFLRPETRAKLNKLEGAEPKTEGAPDAGWSVKRVE